MSFNLELEIKSLLEELGSPQAAAEKLAENFLDPQIESSQEDLQEICRFMLNCGLYQNLVRFCFANISNPELKIPWAYFAQALTRGVQDLNEEVIQFVAMGIEEQNAAEEVSYAEGSDRLIVNAAELKSERGRLRRREAGRLRDTLLEEADMLRNQQLVDQEKKMLLRLKRMFPNDPDISEEIHAHQERHALDILNRHSPISQGTGFREPKPSPETLVQINSLKTSLAKAADKNPELSYEFAVAALMLDAPELSLEILEKMELTIEQSWLLLEVKLQCRRFLEVLSDLNQLELALSHEPETFFATAYLRAQAYWGLQQKHLAIEILESILDARPHYRSSSALLDLWRSQ